MSSKAVPGMYYFELYGGFMGILKASSIVQARSRARAYYGTHNMSVSSVRRATEDDVAWHRAMGGGVVE